MVTDGICQGYNPLQIILSCVFPAAALAGLTEAIMNLIYILAPLAACGGAALGTVAFFGAAVRRTRSVMVCAAVGIIMSLCYLFVLAIIVCIGFFVFLEFCTM